ncbi:hypothetical protein RIF29_30539 [Crotalaria pallida]|uniref:Protein kinase domain-containing protein n=1 Tax=Crotalaria pallida TaxID=3830 RepID=A0AAN9EGJ0_CROPI
MVRDITFDIANNFPLDMLDLSPGGLFETDQNMVDEEVEKKKEEYYNNAMIEKFLELCETDKVVRQGYDQCNLPEVVVNAAHRRMKKYKKDFIESLSCGLLIVKRDDSIQHLIGPKEDGHSSCVRRKETTTTEHYNNREAYKRIEQFKNSVCSVCKNRRPKFEPMKEFTYAELHAATEGFSAKNYLSEGGFGSVYKGTLQGLKIAVKQHKCLSFQGEKEFKSEVNALSKAIHENVVMLLGSCSEGKHRLLVYEFVCNGSLDQHLSQHSRKPLRWQDRIKVAIGAAKGLLYSHENNIIHRDMRPSNILVTHDYEAMLGDFGLARTEQLDTIYSTDVFGTLGYLAPEYAESGKFSTKTDVYSFGVVLLQLITGMRTTDKRLGGKSLARPLLKERSYPDLIDERIMDNHDYHQLFWMIRLAEKCLSRDPQKRLAMNTVVSALIHIVGGNTCSVVLRDCSPTRSDSSYDMSVDSLKSEGFQELATEDGSICSGYTPQFNLNSPPSPPMGSTSSSTSSSTIFTGMSESPSHHDFTTNEKKGEMLHHQCGFC